MSQIIALRDALRPHLGWQGARLSFVAAFLIALFRVKTVNLAELAIAFIGKAQPESHYKRMQRFFGEFEVEYGTIANTVIALVERLLTLFPDAQIQNLIADREFLGSVWFRYLLRYPRIRFRIRIRESEKLGDGRRDLKARVVFADLAIGETKTLARQVWGAWVYVAALRLKDGTLVLVATMGQPNRAIADYANRWSIETLFGILKTRRGFCLESTHLNNSERLSKLIALLALALCWAHQVGDWLTEQKPILIKKHGRKAKSIFRTGFVYLRRSVLNLESCSNDFLRVLLFLSCT